MVALPIWSGVLLATLAWLIPLGQVDQAQSAIPPRYYGVNLASAGFAPERLPGIHGQDYLYPDQAIARPFAEMGMNTIRLPFVWERIQPVAFGPLQPEEAARLDASLTALGGFDTIILDVHNYARFHGKPLDKMDKGGEALADLWTKLAARYRTNGKVAYGLMNEPHGVSARAWRTMVDQSISAIRQTGARQLILVPGVRWTGGAAWFDGGSDSSAANLSGLKDPANNFLFEIHQYFDSNTSGTAKECVSASIGRERLSAVTQWLRKEQAGALLGEFGGSADPSCLAALDETLSFLSINGDVWRGWTYWAAGDWWGDYPYNIQPVNGVVKPQTRVIMRHLSRYRQTSSAAAAGAQPGQ